MTSKIAVALLVTFGMGACADAPKDLTFDRANSAMLIIAAPVGVSKNLDEFRKVDLARSEFVPGYLRIYIDNATFDTKPNQINTPDRQRLVSLGVQQVPPGEYALQQSTRSVSWSLSSNYIGTACFSQLSPIYSVKAGEIAIIRVDHVALAGNSGRWARAADAPPDSVVLQEFERAQSDYPGLAGNFTLKQPVAFIRWDSNGIQCVVPKTFEKIANANPGN